MGFAPGGADAALMTSHRRRTSKQRALVEVNRETVPSGNDLPPCTFRKIRVAMEAARGTVRWCQKPWGRCAFIVGLAVIVAGTAGGVVEVVVPPIFMDPAVTVAACS